MPSPWQWEHDDQYLFRLTSTFGWDEAISLCSSLENGIVEAAASRQDDDQEDECFNDFLGRHNRHERSLQEWLRFSHRLLFYVDQWGNAPIHAASYVKPPVTVIDALFRLGRALWTHSNYRTGKTPVWATPCKDGSTPFLVACSTGASTAVLNRYLDEIDHYIQKGWVPKSARMLVIQPDSQGATPLEGFMSFHCGWIKRQLEKKGSRLDEADGSVSSHHFLPRPSREQQAAQSLPDYWDLANRMLLFATMHIRPHSPSSTPVLMHRCAAIAPFCPVSLLEWVVDPHASKDVKGWMPADLSAATPDSTGRLPMHHAIEARDSSRAFEEDMERKEAGSDSDGAERINSGNSIFLYNNPAQERNRAKVARKLLQWHPTAATTPFINGRSPLVQTIANGGTWHPMGCRNNGGSESVGLLQLLWEHSPEQALEKDPVTSLYPFMLAATTYSGHEDEERLERDRDVVDTVYSLLRKAPQLIGDGLASRDR